MNFVSGHIDQLLQKGTRSCEAEHMPEEVSNEQRSHEITEGNDDEIAHRFTCCNFPRHTSQRHCHHIACQQLSARQ
ncbi:hypothetical protein D1872_329140 [compost metagenome]